VTYWTPPRTVCGQPLSGAGQVGGVGAVTYECEECQQLVGHSGHLSPECGASVDSLEYTFLGG
jgi:hypothetical protein